MAHLSMNSPVGPLTILEEGGAIVVLEWGRADSPEPQIQTDLLEKARSQLNEFFDGKRKDFFLPLAPKGSVFQCAVWGRLSRIPYGSAQTYGDIAKAMESSPRAVGGACGRNPIPIIIPCHRVVAMGGKLGGFSGGSGLVTKKVLLRLEGYPVT